MSRKKDDEPLGKAVIVICKSDLDKLKERLEDKEWIELKFDIDSELYIAPSRDDPETVEIRFDGCCIKISRRNFMEMLSTYKRWYLEKTGKTQPIRKPLTSPFFAFLKFF